MNKIIRTLTLNDEVSLVAMDTTDMVNEAIRIHSLSPTAAKVFGKTLTAMTYMASWLKDESGQVSVNVKGNGTGGLICVSGNSALNMRGVIANPDLHCYEGEVIGNEGYMTIVRDDAYSQPFVGMVPINIGSVEFMFENYYRTSEQLPTFMHLEVVIGEDRKCVSSTGLILQPLPFASFEAQGKAIDMCHSLPNMAMLVKEKGLESVIKEYFSDNIIEEKNAEYKCTCSRRYIEGVILSMGKDELDSIIEQEGKVNVHCHFCNTDYDFYKEDIDKLFDKKD